MASFMCRFGMRRSMAAIAGACSVGAAIYYKDAVLLARKGNHEASLKFPASANYPDLNMHQRSVINEYLTPGVSTGGENGGVGGACCENRGEECGGGERREEPGGEG